MSTPPPSRIAEIRAELDSIAPLPENGPVTVAELARYFAVRAQERGWRTLNGATLDRAQIAAMAAEFAAAHALYALYAQSHAGPELPLGIEPAVDEALRGITPDEAATQLRDAICDGDGIGEWLYAHLGDKTCRKVNDLASELDAALLAKRESRTAMQPDPVCICTLTGDSLIYEPGCPVHAPDDLPAVRG
jgi:hypothetical protein